MVVVEAAVAPRDSGEHAISPHHQASALSGLADSQCLSPGLSNAIAEAIQASERVHSGEIRFAIEGALDGLPLWRGQAARERAIDLFSQLRVWDTEHNNGVLIYLLLADKAVEIVADRGINARASRPTWNAICQRRLPDRIFRPERSMASTL